jgi:hypothetical protein
MRRFFDDAASEFFPEVGFQEVSPNRLGNALLGNIGWAIPTSRLPTIVCAPEVAHRRVVTPNLRGSTDSISDLSK